MKIYIWIGKGLYVGGQVIVIAKNLKSAKKLILVELNSLGLIYKDTDSIESYPISKEGVIYSDDGDY